MKKKFKIIKKFKLKIKINKKFKQKNKNNMKKKKKVIKLKYLYHRIKTKKIVFQIRRVSSAVSL